MAVATSVALRRAPNVLVIDTDLAFHTFVSKALTGKFAREVLATRSMSEAANHIRSGKVDICLFEPEVCRKTNAEFARWLRDPHACPHTEVPLVLLTASGDKALLAKVGQFGIEGVIRKPVTVDVLIGRLSTIITERKRFILADGFAGEDRRKDEMPDYSGPPRRYHEKQAEAVVKSGEVLAPMIQKLAESVILEAPVKKEASPLPTVETPAARPVVMAPPAPSPAPISPPKNVAAPLPPKPVLSAEPIELATLPVKPTPKSSGVIGDEDLVPVAKKEKKLSSNEEWLAEMATEHREKPEASQIDIAKLVAEHNLWLTTKGEQGVRASFADKDIAGVDFSGIALTNADFRNVVMSDSICVEAHFDGADFRNADLSATNFNKAVLSVARMRHANLSLANLSEADFKHADLSGAKFAKACCDGANFTGAILLGADSRDADLSAVEGLKQIQLAKVVGDHTTKLPPGLFVSN
jgi:DNA-binding NarL/FixJ family response regulator